MLLKKCITITINNNNEYCYYAGRGVQLEREAPLAPDVAPPAARDLLILGAIHSIM